jgi:hypothetical protein
VGAGIPLEGCGKEKMAMTRILVETAMVVLVLVLGLEVLHYRNAVLESNVDRKRAWQTVIELRRRCGDERLSK